MACCVISHLWLFCKGMLKCLEKMLTRPKWKVRNGLENFLSKAFQKFHIIIWFCTKLEDVLEVFLMLMPESFLDWFIFIWGREQCSKTSCEISPESHYYLKDLKHVYYACHGKDYGKEDQTLLIDNEPNNALWNWKWNGLFLESFRRQMLSKNMVQWLDLPSCLWPPLVRLPWAKIV